MTLRTMTQRRRIGAAVWAVGMVIAFGWGGTRACSIHVPGVGFGPPVLVAPLEPGRVLRLDVGLHTRVNADDVVAEIDPVLVQAEYDYASAMVLATRDQLRIAQATEERRFADSADGTALTRADIGTTIREDEALLATLQEQLRIEEGLAAKGAVSGLGADMVRWQIDIVEARLRASRSELHLADTVAANAVERSASAPVYNDWQVAAAVRAMELVQRRLGEYRLRAGIDGHVTAIFVSPGAMVSEAVPVMEVRPLTTRDVIAYVGEGDVSRLVPGEPATVVRASGARLDGRLVSIGGSPQALPLSLWPLPNEPRFAVPVRIELLGAEVSPDEPLSVRL
jgi:membrane fusion protein, multidrug efflux system